MNVYDFDGTIRRGDTSADFYFFALRRHPAILLDVPRVAWCFLLHKLRRRTLTQFKSVFFCFLRRLPDTAAEVELFRQKNEGCLDDWYLAQARPDDVVITASPEWLVSPLCAVPGVTVIGTDVDPRTGAIRGENCKGAEKVVRLRARCGEDAARKIDRFYSDSASDTPLALLAKEAYLVGKKCELKPWKR